MSPRVLPELEAIAPGLVIFDKDGTLIHFHAMWGTWAETLAQRLESQGLPSARVRLLQAFGVDPRTGRISARGPLATRSMSDLFEIACRVLADYGLSPEAARAYVTRVWHVPDPLATARPLADLGKLFRTLRESGFAIAIATTDDRGPTEALLDAWDLREHVVALACGDDGLPLKPAPDMVRHLCDITGIPPERTVVVGDTPADMAMGQAAGVKLLIGVLSGVGTAAELATYGAVVLPAITALVERS